MKFHRLNGMQMDLAARKKRIESVQDESLKKELSDIQEKCAEEYRDMCRLIEACKDPSTRVILHMFYLEGKTSVEISNRFAKNGIYMTEVCVRKRILKWRKENNVES